MIIIQVAIWNVKCLKIIFLSIYAVNYIYNGIFVYKHLFFHLDVICKYFQEFWIVYAWYCFSHSLSMWSYGVTLSWVRHNLCKSESLNFGKEILSSVGEKALVKFIKVAFFILTASSNKFMIHGSRLLIPVISYTTCYEHYGFIGNVR